MKIHILHCGYIRVDESVPCGGGLSLGRSAAQLTCRDSRRVTLPCCCYLIEHPRGLLLVDTGWCRDLSPRGVYDGRAAARVLSPPLAAFYRPTLPPGMAIHEQLAGRGLRPEDLACVLLTHLDPDHVAGLRHVAGARRIVLPEDEYFWACRAVYKARQPWKLWIDQPIERVFYRGSPLGPNRWAIDLFGDGSVTLVNVPGHTDGMAAVLLRQGGRFALLAADAAFCERNWRDLLLPGFGFDERAQRRSLQWIRDMALSPGCAAVLCSHDPAVSPGTIEL